MKENADFLFVLGPGFKVVTDFGKMATHDFCIVKMIRRSNHKKKSSYVLKSNEGFFSTYLHGL